MSGIARDQIGNPEQRKSPLVVAFAENNGQQGFEVRDSPAAFSDAALLRAGVAVNVIGRDRVDVTVEHALPKRLHVGRLTEWRIDLGESPPFQVTSCVR